jgi:hypothetical protein
VNQPNFRRDNVPDFVVLPEDFSGIEEVLVFAEGVETLDGGSVEPGDIQEVTVFSKEPVIDGGAIAMRKHVAATVLVLWCVWTLLGLIVFLETGNTILLLGSPAIMSVPLYKVIGYYF